MKTTYTLQEVCEWSKGDNPQFRYVLVRVYRPNRSPICRVLELPEKDAIALCEKMKEISK